MTAESETPFNTDSQMRHGVADAVAPGVRRVVANNPSPMTFTGTASYLVGERDLALIDPGPDDAAHAEALLSAVPPGGRIGTILVTHAHRDHTGNVARLKAATGAPVLAFGPFGAGRSPRMAALADRLPPGAGGEGGDRDFVPDRCLVDGEAVAGEGWRLRAVHTPGHLGNHLCFALEGTGVLFSGDTVMGWSTTVVTPPDGDMAAFMRSLRRLSGRRETRYLPGHGHPIDDPAGMIAWQIAHREGRERSILSALQAGPATAGMLVERIYEGLNPALTGAAARNVLAHLLALEETGQARCADPLAPDARFALTG
jgi:glyoxylase-like metal-dependent hydrolase (beta-lactamase superfamily II)